MSTDTPRRRAGRPPQIDAEGIVVAAVALIDAEGLEALTMRRLGTELGVTAMSLYRHLPNRDAVLAAVVNRLAGEVAVEAADATPWPQALHGFARAYRRMLLAHPNAVPLLATHPVDEAAGRAVIAPVLERFRAAGITDGDAVTAVQSVAVYVLGHALAEVGTPPGTTRDPQPAEAAYYDQWFDVGLDAMVQGFRHRLAADPSC
ncbi:TetR/AcrR family transcriptional regulator C-terminal domain-containing protein [Kitasatospora sp. NPDC097643]|uniref:TetR/AcrR family transcriptional regulator n=1 Tax=Kitasatospora sp. NPDC097643 TaxID=3157230 RepID=UPI0033285680